MRSPSANKAVLNKESYSCQEVQSILPCELPHFRCNKLWDSWKYLQSQTSLTSSLSVLTGNTEIKSFNCLFLEGVLVSRASNQLKVIDSCFFYFFFDRAIRNRALFCTFLSTIIYCNRKQSIITIMRRYSYITAISGSLLRTIKSLFFKIPGTGVTLINECWHLLVNIILPAPLVHQICCLPFWLIWPCPCYI